MGGREPQSLSTERLGRCYKIWPYTGNAQRKLIWMPTVLRVSYMTESPTVVNKHVDQSRRTGRVLVNMVQCHIVTCATGAGEEMTLFTEAIDPSEKVAGRGEELEVQQTPPPPRFRKCHKNRHPKFALLGLPNTDGNGQKSEDGGYEIRVIPG